MSEALIHIVQLSSWQEQQQQHQWRNWQNWHQSKTNKLFLEKVICCSSSLQCLLLLHYQKYVIDSSTAGMHNSRPVGQMWPAGAWNLARRAQHFVLLSCFLDECTLWMDKNIAIWPLGMAQIVFWPAMRFKLCIPALQFLSLSLFFKCFDLLLLLYVGKYLTALSQSYTMSFVL